MSKILSAFSRFVKVAAVALISAVQRIARAEGRGVIERAIQSAAADVAEVYVRSVNGAGELSR